jgi:predicted aspartyl protease
VGTTVGGVDQRRRPLVRVKLVGAEDSFLALVDTGFNGNLLLTRTVAIQLGFCLRKDTDVVEFADGRSEAVTAGYGVIEWLGGVRRVEIFASSDPQRPRIPRDGEPVALLGTGLLAPHILLIDFEAGTVEIERQV